MSFEAHIVVGETLVYGEGGLRQVTVTFSGGAGTVDVDWGDGRDIVHTGAGSGSFATGVAEGLYTAVVSDDNESIEIPYAVPTPDDPPPPPPPNPDYRHMIGREQTEAIQLEAGPRKLGFRG